MKILFVCRGNVGRSQMGEEIFRQLTKGEYETSSAGTSVYDKEGVSQDGKKLGDLVAANEVVNSLKEIGVDAGDNVRTQLTPEMVEGADKIIVMAEPETIPDYLKNSDKVTYWEVADPKGMDQQDTNKIRDQITELVKGFIGTIR
ncbi:MAG: low molecular weight phosphatase family protein [Candidatus Pacebacteria bacterium]|nr:low molecular weight phosphatase family protein [Candidatus Paceibacterota bacterium]